ncbi:hypothetical protein tb265_25700 [Gemmatimonadetes bacterium T265]|nr:hypothetical protein tb265_25700 [Gemmatimonadetes bacterium T265]
MASSDPRSDAVTSSSDSAAARSAAPQSTAAGARDAARTAATGQTANGAGGAPADGGVGATGGNAGTAAAGAVAGTMAGLQSGALAGAVTLGVGAIAGAALGAAAGAALGEDAQRGQFTPEADAYYRALYEDAPAGGRSYDAVRAAYVFGHVAASEPGLAGQTFEEAEPALHEAWTDELRARAGDWASVRAYVHDAYGHSRADGAGERRDRSVIGSAGSAVDPVELDRARHGLPSVPGLADGPGVPGVPGADD